MATARNMVTRVAVVLAVGAAVMAADTNWGVPADAAQETPAARGDEPPPDEPPPDEAPEDEAPEDQAPDDQAPDDQAPEDEAPEQDEPPAPDRRSAPDDRTPSHPGGIDDTCPEVLGGRPGDSLTKETDPPDGAQVQPGEQITVRLQWDPDRFAGDALHKALDCVTIDGVLAEDLSVQERETPNDGEFVHRYRVPDDAEPGFEICDRGFISGDGPGGDFVRDKSNDVCFEVAPAGEESEPADEESSAVERLLKRAKTLTPVLFWR